VTCGAVLRTLQKQFFDECMAKGRATEGAFEGELEVFMRIASEHAETFPAALWHGRTGRTYVDCRTARFVRAGPVCQRCADAAQVIEKVS
jgi:hypothetical protein